MDRSIVDLENRVFEWKVKDLNSFILEYPIFSSISRD